MTPPADRAPHTGDDPRARAAAYLTADIPPVRGAMRAAPEDFVVEEVPLYEPCGQGEHLYLFIEKRGVPTLRAVEMIARHYAVRPRDVGYAGLKDKHAVTRQWLSIYLPRKEETPAEPFDHHAVRILRESRHENKLRRGHLTANRFEITLRDPQGDPAHARAALERIAALGVPNRAGEQRFGMRANNHRVGRAIIMGDADAFLDELLAPDADTDRADAPARDLYAAGDYEGALHAFPRACRAERQALGFLARKGRNPRVFHAIDETQRVFWLSAMQSAVFNHALDQRIASGALAHLQPGDIAMKLLGFRAGPVFEVTETTLTDDADDIPARLAGLELTPTGPMWGPRMPRAAGAVAQVETDALAAFALTPEDIDAFCARHGERWMPGQRRPYRAVLRDPGAEAGRDDRGPFIRCSFTLSPGAFATVVMDEVMKPNLQYDPA